MTKSSVKVISLLNKHFTNDSDKVWTWLTTASEDFGGNQPLHLLMNDREEIVLQFIEAHRDGKL